MVIAESAAAQQACLQLEAQLAALERQSSQSVYRSLLGQYEQARAAYDQTYRQAEQMDCLPRLLRPQLPASCNAIRSQLDQTLARLTQAQEQLRLSDPNQNAAQRANILQALAANNCGAQYEPYRNQPVQIGGGRLLDRLLGLPLNNNVVGNNLIPLVTTYRTLCVRSCDGYYFPISFSTTPTQFEADERTCQAQCPGARLYVHENPGQPVDTAVAINGDPYTQLANAFAFREAYYPQCGCRPMTNAEKPEALFTPIGEEAAFVIANIAPAVPLPLPRPEPTEDPETIANRFGGFVPGAFNLGAATDTTALMVSDQGTRLIGPAYYYAQ